MPLIAPPEALDALFVAPHPDDAELGAGGTILRLIQRGWRVGILDLTSGEPTPLGSVGRRRAETEAANREIGSPWRHNLGLPNRELEPTLAHRRALAGVFRRVRPRLLFAPYWEDAHPDHLAATALVEAARFWSKLSKSDLPAEPFHPARIFYYFSVHLRIVERPSFVVDISAQAAEKRRALTAYESQLVENQPAGRPGVIDAVFDRTRFWGHLAGVEHAEPFAGREPIGLAHLDSLIVWAVVTARRPRRLGCVQGPEDPKVARRAGWLDGGVRGGGPAGRSAGDLPEEPGWKCDCDHIGSWRSNGLEIVGSRGWGRRLFAPPA